MIYITQSNIDDICELGKIVSIESCRDCKYCKELHREKAIYGGFLNPNIIKVECDYENN